MKNWLRTVWLMMLCSGMALQAKEGGVNAPSNDSKDPSTLNNTLTPEPTPDLLPLVAEAETSFNGEMAPEGETTYQAQPPAPKPEALALKTGAFDKRLGEVRVRGYLARPAKAKVKAAVVLIHEWWGLNASVKKTADQLAGEGFKVLAVDLYNGEVAQTRPDAARLMNKVDPAKALARLEAALTLVSTQDGEAKPLKVGVVGWGFGGTQALRLALGDKRPAALALFYCELPKDTAQVAKLPCPVLGIFAARDAWVTPKKVQNFKQALEQAKIPAEIISYFTAPGFALMPDEVHDQAFAETANKKLVVFLKKELAS